MRSLGGCRGKSHGTMPSFLFSNPSSKGTTECFFLTASGSRRFLVRCRDGGPSRAFPFHRAPGSYSVAGWRKTTSSAKPLTWRAFFPSFSLNVPVAKSMRFLLQQVQHWERQRCWGWRLWGSIRLRFSNPPVPRRPSRGRVPCARRLTPPPRSRATFASKPRLTFPLGRVPKRPRGIACWRLGIVPLRPNQSCSRWMRKECSFGLWPPLQRPVWPFVWSSSLPFRDSCFLMQSAGCKSPRQRP